MTNCRIGLAIVPCLFIICCSESIDSSGQDNVEYARSLVPQTDPNGYWGMTVDATSHQTWTKINLQGGVVIDDSVWDLAFRRFSVRLNGGDSGPGYGLGQKQAGNEFGVVRIAPNSGWTTDGDDVADLAFSDWYEYDLDTHRLTPTTGTWLLRSGDGLRFYEFQIRAYYDSAGDSGFYELIWSELDSPIEALERVAGTGQLPTATDNPRQNDVSDTSGEFENSDSHGCYSGPPDHQCECDVSSGECEANSGTWTGRCDCSQ